MDSLAKRWQQLNLSNEEENEIVVDVGKLMEVNSKGKTSIIGKLHADHTISKEIIQKSMSKIWRTSKPFCILDIKQNIFIFSFDNDDDMNWVMHRETWLFETSLMSLKAFDKNILVTKMDFSSEAFWVNMHDLPIRCMNAEMGNQLGSTIGVVRDCDVNKDGSGWGMALRVLIKLKLEKPITRVRFLNVEGSRHWIPFTYEKLPRIYFECRRIVHGEETYNNGKLSPKNSTGQFEPWLRETSGFKNGRQRTHGGFQASSSTGKSN